MGEENDEEVYGFIETNEQWHENDEQKKYLFLVTQIQLGIV